MTSCMISPLDDHSTIHVALIKAPLAGLLMNVTILFSILHWWYPITSTRTATVFTFFRIILRLEKKNTSVCHLCPAWGTTGVKDFLFRHRLLALAEAAIVSIILVTLGVPLVVVARSQMYVGLISRIAGEVMEVKRFS